MRRRSGFTLVELLVAMGLVLLMMAILAEAFQVGLTSFRTLRAVGDMNDELRVASVFIRRDLAADHFEGGTRLSDPNFGGSFNAGGGDRLAQYAGPLQGFFRVHQFSGSIPEGSQDGITTFRSPPAAGVVGAHLLHFTVKRKGNNITDFFSAGVSPSSPLMAAPDQTTYFNQQPDARYQTGSYRSQWCEVIYFLAPIPNETANGAPLYTLNRYLKLLVTRNDGTLTSPVAGIGVTDPYAAMSWRLDSSGANCIFNTPFDVSDPAKRGFSPTTISNPANLATVTGSVQTMLLTNVVSFDVQVLPTPTAAKVAQSFDYPVLRDSQSNPNTVDPFMDTGDYDTGTGGLGGLGGIQIILRVYDAKTQQTRQVTIIQDL